MTTIKSTESIQCGTKAKYVRPKGYEQWKIGVYTRLLITRVAARHLLYKSQTSGCLCLVMINVRSGVCIL